MYDLVDEMMWEDLEEFVTLEEANIEENSLDTASMNVPDIIDWFYDGEDSRYESN